MKKILIVIGVLILAVCATGWFFTYRALGATQAQMQETRTILSAAQVKLQDTAINLEGTQQKLQDTAKNLQETRQSLTDQTSQTTRYKSLYEDNTKILEEKQAELQTTIDQLSTSQLQNKSLQDKNNELQKSLALYKDTLGVQVFSDIMPLVHSGNLTSIQLVNNPSATNPTWQQLVNFLVQDKTDKHLYIPGVYECGNFAQDAHNNAEAKGIRAAFVSVRFSNNTIGHAIIAFKTTDRGLVYIDETGATSPISLPNMDAKVELEKGKPYRAILMFPDVWYIPSSNEIVQSYEIYW